MTSAQRRELQECSTDCNIRVSPLEEMDFHLQLVRGSQGFRCVSTDPKAWIPRKQMQRELRKGRNAGARDGGAGNHFLLPEQPMPSNRTFFSDENVQYSELSNTTVTDHMWFLWLRSCISKINFVWTNLALKSPMCLMTAIFSRAVLEWKLLQGWLRTHSRRSCSSQSSDFRELSSSLRANLLLENIVLNPPKEDVTTEERWSSLRTFCDIYRADK